MNGNSKRRNIMKFYGQLILLSLLVVSIIIGTSWIESRPSGNKVCEFEHYDSNYSVYIDGIEYWHDMGKVFEITGRQPTGNYDSIRKIHYTIYKGFLSKLVLRSIVEPILHPTELPTQVVVDDFVAEDILGRERVKKAKARLEKDIKRLTCD